MCCCNPGSINRQFSILLTGYGKPITFGMQAEPLRGRTLVIAHREELLLQVRAAEEELKREFPRAQELQEKVARLAQLNAELTLSEHGGISPNTGEVSEGETETQPVSPTSVTPEVVEAVNF